MEDFKEYLLLNRKEKNIRLVFDIETLQYNEERGRVKPSEYKNVTYSVAVGYFKEKEIGIVVFPNFKYFFNFILRTYQQWKTLPKFELIAHNSNKYDNHFLRHSLINFYSLPVENLHLKNATEEGNVLTTKKSSVDKLKKQGLILEKRVKSSNNLEMNFFINGIEFKTTDNYIKTNASIATLGKKLLNLNLINEEDLKTDFDYKKYNKDYDMNEVQAEEYALNVFQNLDNKEMKYIRNDIIILANSIKHYSTLFQGFSYDKITFTSNILEYYNDNDLTSYQLLKSVGKGKDKIHLRYTNYKFDGQNFYDYLKSFYGGGLNFYNDTLVGRILKYPCFTLDINSSYPYVMHNFPVPTFLNSYQEYEDPTEIKVNNNDKFYLYKMTKLDFDMYITDKIDSRIIRQMIVKYYTKNDYMNINTYTLKMIENVCKIKIDIIKVLSFVSFDCVSFGSKEKIAEKYKVKQSGSSKKKIVYNSPYDIEELDVENDSVFTTGEIDISKVILNGLYGIPALRSHFNVFRWVNGELLNIPNGFVNNERNIVFSVFVTAVSLYNLLEPLKNLTQEEIDKYFIYCDTDSLYLNKKIMHKMPKYLFDNNHLGSWAVDDENIKEMIVINHKKYAYLTYSEKEKKDIIKVKAGGVPNNAFKKDNVTFSEFVEKQFSNNVSIINTKSIANKQGTISIYDSKTVLKVGSGYRVLAYDPFLEDMKSRMFDEIRHSSVGDEADMLYIESNLGTFSMSDLSPVEHEKVKNKKNLMFLKIEEEDLKRTYLQLD